MSTPDKLLDTNVLVAASQPVRRGHDVAWALIDGPGTLAVTPQVLREYLAVATRPASGNGLGIDVTAALANVEVFLEAFTLLPDDGRVAARLRSLLSMGLAAGLQAHDANIVASALAHGVPCVVTDNRRHFERFADLIVIEDLN